MFDNVFIDEKAWVKRNVTPAENFMDASYERSQEKGGQLLSIFLYVNEYWIISLQMENRFEAIDMF